MLKPPSICGMIQIVDDGIVCFSCPHWRKEEIGKRKKEGNEAGKEGRKEESHLLHIRSVNTF